TVAESFAARCGTYGVALTYSNAVPVANPPQNTDYTGALQAMAASPPDFIYIAATSPVAAGRLVEQMRSPQCSDTHGSTQLGVSNGALTGDFWVTANTGGTTAAQGAYVSTYDFGYDVNPNSDPTQPNNALAQFYADYGDTFGLLVADRTPPTVTEFPPYIQ